MDKESAEYTLKDLEVGQKSSFSLKISESMVIDFANLSGDNNPLHMDEEYAKKTKFGKRVCHGMLLASFFSKLVGMYLPGKNSLYFSQTLNFTLPCFMGDQITIEGQILDKSLASRIITLKTTIHNQNGQCLVDGTAKVMVLK